MRYSNKVQLRLQMTSAQIEDMNRRIKDNAPNEYRKCRRIYDEAIRKTYNDVDRANPPHSTRTPAHWKYYAAQAHEIAQGKTNRNARKFWLKRAKAYGERSKAVRDSGSV